MRLLPCGDAAVLVELGSLAEVRGLHAALEAAPPAGVVDLVPAARTVLVVFDAAVTDRAAVGAAVRAAGGSAAPPAAGELVELPVRYDGADLAEVGRHTGLGARGVVDVHTATVWVVAFCGFSPGFGYLVAEAPDAAGVLQVPRRESPRTRVPAGAVGLAGEFSGVYPRESPGGWQLLGTTDREVWDPRRREPALLRPGVRVRFVERS